MVVAPRRADYAEGADGRSAYHNARAQWYLRRTGKELFGTLAEQEELFDNACRYLCVRVRRGDRE